MGVQFAFNEDLFGSLEHVDRQSAVAFGKDHAQPEHIQFNFAGSEGFDAGQVVIYPTAQYEALSDKAAEQISTLRSLLDERPTEVNGPLPLLPMLNAIETYHTEPNFISFQNGSGISFVVQVDHDHDLTSEEILFYTFQGITNDGNFYVAALFPLAGNFDSGGATADPGETVAQVANKRVRVGTALETIRPMLDNTMRTMKIVPEKGFPSSIPPAYVSISGMMMAYDPDLSGEATFERVPSVFTGSDGSVEFLPGLPDTIRVTFDKGLGEEQPSTLLIKPIRDDQKQFFQAIPMQERQLVANLETRLTEGNNRNQVHSGEMLNRLLPFESGLGLRQIETISLSSGEEELIHLIYEFEGLTENGRYYVHFNHPVNLSGSLDEVILNANAADSAEFLSILAQLDNMVQSLVVAPDASMDSSVPVNPPDCIHDAQFVKDITIPDNTVIERGEKFTKIWRVRNIGTCTWTPAFQVVLAGGNPLSWSRVDVVDIVPPDEETEIKVEILSPEVPGTYQAWWQLTDESGKPFGASYYALFEAPRPATEIPGHGVVEGQISYPAGGMPAMTIYFIRTDGSQRFALETEQGWTHYVNELPTGEYYVFARVQGDESDSGGGYTEAAVCGLTCEDHSLVEVVIKEGEATSDINVLDWFAPAGTFPLP